MFFFFNDTATTEIYTLSLHDALPILLGFIMRFATGSTVISPELRGGLTIGFCSARSEEHTSELQSQSNLVCRLLLEKKKNKQPMPFAHPPVANFPLVEPQHLFHVVEP